MSCQVESSQVHILVFVANIYAHTLSHLFTHLLVYLFNHLLNHYLLNPLTTFSTLIPPSRPSYHLHKALASRGHMAIIRRPDGTFYSETFKDYGRFEVETVLAALVALPEEIR